MKTLGRLTVQAIILFLALYCLAAFELVINQWLIVRLGLIAGVFVFVAGNLTIASLVALIHVFYKTAAIRRRA